MSHTHTVFHLAQAFHLEVVGGLIHVLAPYAETTTVYLHPLNFPDRPVDFGFVDTILRHKVSRELRFWLCA